jgi:putative peptidoglycan lipid II flippase
MGDTKTPVKTAAVALLINLTLNLILMWPLKVGGLALATSIAATVNFVMLYILLSKRLGDFGTRNILISFAKVFCATMLMAVFTFFISKRFFVPGQGSFFALIRLFGVIAASGAIYAVSCYLLRVEGVNSLFKRVKKS